MTRQSRDTTPRTQKSKGKSTHRWTSSPNGVHRAFKGPIQLPHRDGEKENRQVQTVCRLQTDKREVSEGCLPNAPHKLHPRSTKVRAVHQQLGPEGWVLADPTGKAGNTRRSRSQAKVYSSGEQCRWDTRKDTYKDGTRIRVTIRDSNGKLCSKDTLRIPQGYPKDIPRIP